MTSQEQKRNTIVEHVLKSSPFYVKIDSKIEQNEHLHYQIRFANVR